MVSGANVCDELQGLDLNSLALILSTFFFFALYFYPVVPVTIEGFWSFFVFAYLQWILSWLF